MSLEQLQAALARSLVASEAAKAEAPLPPGIAAEDIRQGRRTLRRKRLSYTRSLLPRTAAALGDRFAECFFAFAEEHHPSGFRAPLLDAVAFSRWLCRRPDLPPWIRESARWEALFCRWTLARNLLAVLSLKYDVMSAAISLESEPPKRRSWWIAWRVLGRGAVRHVGW